MIHTTRARTPANENDDGDASFPPHTSRKGLMPKFSAYFNQNVHFGGNEKWSIRQGEGIFQPTLPTWPAETPYPSPEAERLIESIMCRVLAQPHEGLEAQFNGMLLRIFESYRTVQEEAQNMRTKVDHEVTRSNAIERAMKLSTQHWEIERQGYKAEIKRLELIIASRGGGLADVAMARQYSVLPHRRGRDVRATDDDPTQDTMFHYVEKSKHHEAPLWCSQRGRPPARSLQSALTHCLATMRQRLPSPSAKMRHLSRVLESKGHADFQPGTPRRMGTLAKVSHEERSARVHYAKHEKAHSNKRRESASDDSTSAFSCPGDLLPDELAEIQRAHASVSDNDLAAVRRIARTLAKRQHAEEEIIAARLVQLLSGNSSGEPLRSQSQRNAAQSASMPRMQPMMRPQPGRLFNTNNKQRPRLTVDTNALNRKFSFEKGDDAHATLSATEALTAPVGSELLPTAVRDRLLRKCASTSILSDVTRHEVNLPPRPLSPVDHSPTTSIPTSTSESKRPSRIPTPVFSTAALARPRQNRESSSSSLLTAIKHSDDSFHRAGSMSSSRSSPSTSRVGGVQDQPSPNNQENTNHLAEHTRALRGHASGGRRKVRAHGGLEGEDAEGNVSGDKVKGLRGR